MSFPDRLISADLRELAAEARRQPGALPVALAAVNDADPYRDDLAGARARRDALLAQRRLELALVPRELGAVAADRAARKAVGGVAAVCAAGIVGGLLVGGAPATASAPPGGFQLASWQLSAAVIASGMAMIGAFIAGWIAAQRRFLRGVDRAIPVSGDLHADLDHLARGPLELAHELARRADRGSVALLVGGGSAFAAVLGYAVTAISFQPVGWSLLIDEGEGAFRAWLPYLGAVLAGIAVFVHRLHRACAEERFVGTLPTWARALMTRSVAGAAVALGVACVGALSSVTTRPSPTTEAPPSLALMATGCVAVLTAHYALRKRRREQAQLKALAEQAE
jgi:hypothetical protein